MIRPPPEPPKTLELLEVHAKVRQHRDGLLRRRLQQRQEVVRDPPHPDEGVGEVGVARAALEDVRRVAQKGYGRRVGAQVDRIAHVGVHEALQPVEGLELGAEAGVVLGEDAPAAGLVAGFAAGEEEGEAARADVVAHDGDDGLCALEEGHPLGAAALAHQEGPIGLPGAAQGCRPVS